MSILVLRFCNLFKKMLAGLITKNSCDRCGTLDAVVVELSSNSPKKGPGVFFGDIQM